MNIREQREQLARAVCEDIQESVYGKVKLENDVFMNTYKLYIIDRDIYYAIDITDDIRNGYFDIYDKIMNDYKRTILGKYLVG